MAGPETDAAEVSARRLRANRANAKRSTGPRTEDGKARAARNALRHGLSLGSGSLAELAPEIERLTIRLAGEGVDEACLDLAGRAAEAHVDLLRIRHMRRALLAAAGAALEQEERAQREAAPQDRIASRILRPDGRVRASFLSILRRSAGVARVSGPLDSSAGQQAGQSAPPAPRLWEFDRLLQEMARLERYERRAISRRKRALRALLESQPVAD